MIETVLTELAKAGGTELFLSSSEKLWFNHKFYVMADS